MAVPQTDIKLDLRIDGYEADLVPVVWMGVSPQRVIAVAQTQDSQIRFFGEDGTPLGFVGRPGEGPGEFRWITRGGWIGDTLWISDTGLDRVTLVAPDLKTVRVLTPLAGARPQGADRASLPIFPFVSPYAVYPGDTILASAMGAAGDPLAERLKGVVLVRVTLQGVVQRLVLQPPVNEGEVRITFEGGSGGAAVPFFARPRWAVSPDGAEIAVVTTEIAGPAGGTFNVHLYNAFDGEVIFAQSFPFAGVPIPDQVVDSVLELNAERAPRPEFRRVYEREMKDRVPPVYPPVRAILVGSDDRVWIGLRAIDNGHPWLVLDTTGKPVERVVLPMNFDLMVAGGEYVWGLEADSLDVQNIVRYQLLHPQQ